MKLKCIGPSVELSLVSERIYECVGIEDDLVRIIDEEELINLTQKEIDEAKANGSTDIGYLYSIKTPFASGSSKPGKWEIVEDTSDKMLQKAIEKYS